jgi:hypothetical protein
MTQVSPPQAMTLLTYLWHYLVARTLYDHLVHPLARGDFSAMVLVLSSAAVGFALARATGGRR